MTISERPTLVAAVKYVIYRSLACQVTLFSLPAPGQVWYAVLRMTQETSANLQIGLCDDCQHTKEVVSGKGSRFFYCRRSETDERYAKYPALPVRRCGGYEARLQSPPSE